MIVEDVVHPLEKATAQALLVLDGTVTSPICLKVKPIASTPVDRLA